MPQRITEDFSKLLTLLKTKTGNSPNGIRQALEKDPNLGAVINELHRLSRHINRHENFSKRRYIVQTDPSFPKDLKDYRSHWENSIFTYWDWLAEKEGREPLSAFVERDIPETERLPPIYDDDEVWDFDPEIHSATSLVEAAMDYIDSKSDDAPFYSRAYGAYKWLKNVVGLDLCRMERSWREFPVIAVPTQVSNYHGIEDPQSLFRYLDNVRLSCMAGAFLSAISMCRAATEILIRHHYNSKDDVTKLARLIKATEQKSEFRFIKRFNLLEKIDMANDILHFKKRDNYSETIAPVIISGWVKDLSEMIANAPRR